MNGLNHASSGKRKGAERLFMRESVSKLIHIGGVPCCSWPQSLITMQDEKRTAPAFAGPERIEQQHPYKASQYQAVSGDRSLSEFSAFEASPGAASGRQSWSGQSGSESQSSPQGQSGETQSQWPFGRKRLNAETPDGDQAACPVTRGGLLPWPLTCAERAINEKMPLLTPQPPRLRNHRSMLVGSAVRTMPQSGRQRCERSAQRTLVCPTWACTCYLEGGNREE